MKYTVNESFDLDGVMTQVGEVVELSEAFASELGEKVLPFVEEVQPESVETQEAVTPEEVTEVQEQVSEESTPESEPVAEPVVETEPTVEPEAEPAQEVQTEPAVEPAVEPVAEQATEPQTAQTDPSWVGGHKV